MMDFRIYSEWFGRGVINIRNYLWNHSKIYALRGLINFSPTSGLCRHFEIRVATSPLFRFTSKFLLFQIVLSMFSIFPISLSIFIHFPSYSFTFFLFYPPCSGHPSSLFTPVLHTVLDPTTARNICRDPNPRPYHQPRKRHRAGIYLRLSGTFGFV